MCTGLVTVRAVLRLDEEHPRLLRPSPPASSPAHWPDAESDDHATTSSTSCFLIIHRRSPSRGSHSSRAMRRRNHRPVALLGQLASRRLPVVRTRSATARRERLVGGRPPQSPSPRRRGDARGYRRPARRTSLAPTGRRWRARAAARPDRARWRRPSRSERSRAAGVELARRAVPTIDSGSPTSRASASARARTSSGGGSMSSVNGIARFWITVSCVEQHRALADDAEAIDGGEPVGAVGDRRRRPAEDADVAGVRQRRAGRRG